MHLLDKRFEGIAVGVGSSKILGRIHLADMEIGGVIL
jgi:DNA damage-inducible protein 1